ncbi:hypothetical protein HDU92_003096 [Lobulomyces angularis]|nr:hypothetical protein HDU92_003096 [Lobulomyces angularis]
MMTGNPTHLYPEVLWAQRDNEIYLTVHLSDTSDQKFDLTPKSLNFSCLSDDKMYAFNFDFYGEINVDESVFHKSPREIFIILKKKEKDAAWWPKLLEGPKPHFLKTDFVRWKDEDEEEEDTPASRNDLAGMDFQKMMGGNSAGMPDMSQMMAQMGMNKAAQKDSVNTDASNSDDEEESAPPPLETV